MTAARVCHSSTRCLGGLPPGEATALGKVAIFHWRLSMDHYRGRMSLDDQFSDSKGTPRLDASVGLCYAIVLLWHHY